MPSHTRYAPSKFADINGVRMAYVDEGVGDPIVFQHGNPTSSYLWRNVMPHLEGLGRLIACDLVGMGDSDKLVNAGPGRYTYQEQRDHLFRLWDHLGIDGNVVLVLHDWGSMLGFDWANQHRDLVSGIAYMEAIVQPLVWEDFGTEDFRKLFQGIRTPAGEALFLEQNMWIEQVLPGSVLRGLSEQEMAVYRAPFLEPGESRRAMLSCSRQVPVSGAPVDVARIVGDYAAWLAGSSVPKLFVNADPGALITNRHRDFCRRWPNQTEVTVPGLHFLQEDSPDAIGKAIAQFVRKIRTIDSTPA
jgi:haloalkane dehalogenase